MILRELRFFYWYWWWKLFPPKITVGIYTFSLHGLPAEGDSVTVAGRRYVFTHDPVDDDEIRIGRDCLKELEKRLRMWIE